MIYQLLIGGVRMSFCTFSDQFAMYDVTPVENLFLLEYMPYAKGDYVRVYLYGMMLCRHGLGADTLEKCAQQLNLERDKVLEAFKYWEDKGLVTRMSDNPPTYQYSNVRSVFGQSPALDESIYVYAELDKKLEAIFGNLERRYREAAADWVDDLGLKSDVVIEMARQVDRKLTEKNGGKQRSVPYAFTALKDCALDWAERGINTVEAARLEGQKGMPPYLAARQVLSGFNLRRNPTAAEVAMAAKWLEEWGYGEAEILGALKETTKTANPSFAYLDGVLKGMMNRENQGDSREEVKRVLEALGASSRTPTDDLMRSYDKAIAQGFAPDTVLRAAALCNAKGQRTFEKLNDVLGKWLSLGLTTIDKVESYLERRASLRKLTLAIFEKAGVSRDPTDADLDQTLDWMSLAEPEMILCAAEFARGLSIPSRSITKRLKEWAQAGIADVEAAKAFKRPAQGKADNAAQNKNPALNYEQRNLDEKYYEDYLLDIERSRRKEQT